MSIYGENRQKALASTPIDVYYLSTGIHPVPPGTAGNEERKMLVEKITNANLEVITVSDLRAAAARALSAGTEVTYYVCQSEAADYVGPISTLVCGRRAGQATNANARWGEWSADEEMIYVDSDDSHHRLDLQGRAEKF
jgi:hypothetical protein